MSYRVRGHACCTGLGEGVCSGEVLSSNSAVSLSGVLLLSSISLLVLCS